MSVRLSLGSGGGRRAGTGGHTSLFTPDGHHSGQLFILISSHVGCPRSTLSAASP